LLILSTNIICAQKADTTVNDKTVKDGIEFQLGTGAMYGGIGGLVEYQRLIKENFYLTPYAGFGFSLGGLDTTTAKYYWINYALGINLEFGKRHRLILGPQIIGSNNILNKPSNAKIDKKMLIGSSLIIGYKGIASFGLIWQLYLGFAFMQNPFIDDKKFYFSPHIGLGIGYKF